MDTMARRPRGQKEAQLGRNLRGLWVAGALASFCASSQHAPRDFRRPPRLGGGVEPGETGPLAFTTTSDWGPPRIGANKAGWLHSVLRLCLAWADGWAGREHVGLETGRQTPQGRRPAEP